MPANIAILFGPALSSNMLYMGYCRLTDKFAKRGRGSSHGLRNELISSINTEEGSLDILLSLPYTYVVSLQRKYRENEDHGEIW
jgi:hypothetical protein